MNISLAKIINARNALKLAHALAEVHSLDVEYSFADRCAAISAIVDLTVVIDILASKTAVEVTE